VEATLRAVRDEAQLRTEFRRIRWFVGLPLVLWAEPATDQALARWHVSTSALIDPAHCRPHYRPGAWTAHCTPGARIADARSNDAMAFARSFDRDITMLFDVVDCVTRRTWVRAGGSIASSVARSPRRLLCRTFERVVRGGPSVRRFQAGCLH
jgi:hypothetical protein